MELTNPLRGKPLRPLPAQDEKIEPIQAKQVEMPAAKPILEPKQLVKPDISQIKPITRAETNQASVSMVPHSVVVNANPELKKAMELLAKHGIETSAPKKNYIKHSYEIEEDLHNEFHQMYPLLGFKHVKTAINDAIRMWCDQNRSEFNRRKG